MYSKSRSVYMKSGDMFQGPVPADPASDTDLEEWETIVSSRKRYEHEYRPLKSDEIRLLILNPGRPGEPIECFLEHYPLDRAKRYRALSYVWGDSQASSVIQVDGYPFKVTSNLKDFLVSFRSDDTSAVLWIDAVCIDQGNIPERNAQVRSMKRVYEGAESTIIWLGPETDGTKLAVIHMEDIYYEFWLPRQGLEGSIRKTTASITPKDGPEILGENRGYSQEELLKIWAGIMDMLERPWWSRIWVYQEATAPTEGGSVVCCGPYSIAFQIVLTVNRII